MTDNDDEFEDADEVDERESSPSNSNIHNQAPIMIHIDASISILGIGNTLIIPSVAGPQQENSQGMPSSMPRSTVTILRSTQQHRQAKLRTW
ncbi:hypothetical protein BDV23DRAFT_165585 [Aspergillus alliaceus]|uniref:Uncharacterized protein n=1 Tax=Petromyces alliaceus TaxID=209559 RepID=A0A5N7BTY2_PETAA|nr:hypothetical protein BDV23DRAFT_165585 [Aspergillus alliaceus]